MLLTIELGQYLKPNGKETYLFVNDNCPKETKQELLEFDESHFDMYGFHVIDNYKDLKV